MKAQIQKCETAHSIWSSISASISTSLWIRFNTNHVLPWGLRVCLLVLICNGNEGDGLEISTVWSFLQRKGEGCSLQAHTLLTSLPLVPSPVAPLENSCGTGVKEKAKSTTRNSLALAFQILCPSNPTKPHYIDLEDKHLPSAQKSRPDSYHCCQPYLDGDDDDYYY